MRTRGQDVNGSKQCAAEWIQTSTVVHPIMFIDPSQGVSEGDSTAGYISHTVNAGGFRRCWDNKPKSGSHCEPHTQTPTAH